MTWDGRRLSIDVTGVPRATDVTLYIDLIGGDADSAGGLRVDDVSVGLGGVFVRGDANGDGKLDITDPIATLGYLFLGDPAPGCIDTADADDTGRLDLTDPIYSLGYLFLGGAVYPAPYPACGLDPTPDDLGCAAYSCPPGP